MKRLSIFVALALFAVACVNDPTGELPGKTTSESKIVNVNAEPVSGRLMVRLAEDVDAEVLGDIVDIAVDARPLYPRGKNVAKSSFDDWYLLKFDDRADVRAIAERIAEDSRVVKIEFSVYIKRPEYKRVEVSANRPEPTRASNLPFNDPELKYMWHYYNDGTISDTAVAGADINVLNAWKYCAGDNRVIVAVLDGGVMYNHKDLADNMWVNEAEKNGKSGVDDDGNGYVDDIYGYNFVRGNGNVTADDHGTHVAGTISAVNNNGFSTCGIAGGSGNKDGVRIMSLQIFEGNDGCYSHQIAQAFMYAADNGAVLANNSWGYDPGTYASDNEFERWDSEIKNAVDYFEANAKLEGVIDGGVSLFAAGNEEYNEGIYPGAYNKYICVSAMTSNYTGAIYTNYGPGVNICAPGGEDSTAWYDLISSCSVEYANSYGYEYMAGTSMATPHVTGCAALAISYAAKTGKRLTSAQLKNLILTSVHDINQYQTGTKSQFNYATGRYDKVDVSKYQGKLGTGYIDAHLLLMQMDSTPCLYFSTGVQGQYSLDVYFGDGAKDLTYQGVEVSSDVKSELGITTNPTISSGVLKITCTKPGVGRIKVKAIAGGNKVGGGNSMGGMAIEREFEIVVRGAVATNGGWL